MQSALPNGTLDLQGLLATLSSEGAASLNQALGQNLFTTGQPVGGVSLIVPNPPPPVAPKPHTPRDRPGSLLSPGPVAVSGATTIAGVGLSDPHDTAAYDALLPSVTVGPLSPLSGPLEVRDYDPAWPAAYAGEATRVRAVLGERVVRLEHVGSTSVPGLPAKPIIDLVLEVPDSSDEPAYVPDLETAGYVLRIREPSFFEHRMLRDADARVHLHVFSAGCPETERMVRFRDHLRASPADRDLYAATKRDLATRPWKYMQQYADAKSAVVAEIMARATAPR